MPIANSVYSDLANRIPSLDALARRRGMPIPDDEVLPPSQITSVLPGVPPMLANAAQPPDQSQPNIVPPEIASVVGNPQDAATVANAITAPSSPPVLNTNAASTTPVLSPPNIPPDSSGIPNIISRAISAPTSAPQLAPQRGFFSGPTPQPGEPYQPPGTLEKISRVLQVIAPMAQYEGANYGSVQDQDFYTKQKQLANEQQVMRENAIYRNAQAQYFLGRNQTSRDVATTRAEPQVAAAQVRARASGQVLEPNGQGSYSIRPMTTAELSSDPFASAALAHKQAQDNLSQATAAYHAAQQDAIMNPNNPQFQLKAQQAQATLAMAGAHLEIARQNAGLQARRFGIDYYGVDPSTGAPPPGTLATDDNTPVGNKNAGNIRPTTTMRGRAEQATAIQIVGRGLIDQIRQDADVLGPVMGRYGSLTRFVGAPDPRFSELQAALKSWIALHPAAHGFRGLNAVQQFENAYGTPIQTPESLIAAIQGSFGTMQGLQTVGTPRIYKNAPQNAPPATSSAPPKAVTAPPPGWSR